MNFQKTSYFLTGLLLVVFAASCAAPPSAKAPQPQRDGQPALVAPQVADADTDAEPVEGAEVATTTATAPSAVPTPTQAESTTAAARAGLSSADKKALLDQHNIWRARFKVGPVVWDDAVATVAQEWADQQAANGSFEHRQGNRFGENLWSGTAGAFSMASIVDSWGNEVNDYDLKTNTCAAGKACGHFTQVIWFSTTKVGCGKATGATGNDVVVCNYDPPGNMAGQTPFGK